MPKKLKKIEQKITNIAKTQISEATKIISFHLNGMYFYFIYNK